MNKIKVGDKVEHTIYGEGTIKYISQNGYAKLPVKVHFDERKTYAFFTMYGEEYEDGPMKINHW